MTWVVAIDGPGGSGKSSVARLLAQHLGIAYLDTGAFYRSVAWLVAEQQLDPSQPDEISAVLRGKELRQEQGQIWVDDTEITELVRAPLVDRLVSVVATHPSVRERLVTAQQRWVTDHGGAAVVEGRDIGTVVFPSAQLKVFLDADPDIRAQRRRDEDHPQTDTEPPSSTENPAQLLSERDRQDRSRSASPLQPAPDSHRLDTTDLSLEQVVQQILSWLEETEPLPSSNSAEISSQTLASQ